MLTEEEKRRIEANRQRALAIKAQRTSKNNLEHVPPANTAISAESSSKIKTANEPLKCSNREESTPVSKSCAPKNECTHTGIRQSIKVQTAEKNASQVDKNKASLALPKAKCVLISRTRFELESPYIPALIDICRFTDTAAYNSSKKRWHFHLKAYNTFISKSRSISNIVTVEGLPTMVLTAFSAIVNGGASTSSDSNGELEIPSHDLRSIDKRLLSNLFPFQIDAINFAIAKSGRALIADDMGLGKTVEALGIASYYREEWPLLIITPAGVRHTWLEAIDKFFSSDLRRDYIFSPDNKREAIMELSSAPIKSSIFIVSYDLMKSHAEMFVQRKFRVVILDESHFIKDFKSDRCKATMSILKNTTRVVLLSGTPALSRPVELFTQIQCVNSAVFKNFTEYANRYCDAKKRPEKFGGGLDASGASCLEELEILLKETVMIRRLKEQVMSQLNPKRRHVIILDKNLVELENKTLQKAKLNFFDENLKLNEKRGALLMFYNETAKAKLKAVKNHVISLLRSGKKMVVFAHHQLMMDNLHSAIAVEKYGIIRIDGGVSSANRQHLCNKFQNDDSIKVALLSITAAGTGLTLTAASSVVFAELFWNPGVLVQAEDRVHRVGQEADVEVQYLVAEGTADDEIWTLIKHKLEILGKGGLSKDNFNDVLSVNLKSEYDETKQPFRKCTLDDFWESLSVAVTPEDFVQDQGIVDKCLLKAEKQSKSKNGKKFFEFLHMFYFKNDRKR